jgi:nitroreductase
MKKPLSIDIQKELFTEARTVHAFKQHDISDEQIQELYELFKWAPTAFNDKLLQIKEEEEAKAALLRKQAKEEAATAIKR